MELKSFSVFLGQKGKLPVPPEFKFEKEWKNSVLGVTEINGNNLWKNWDKDQTPSRDYFGPERHGQVVRWNQALCPILPGIFLKTAPSYSCRKNKGQRMSQAGLHSRLALRHSSKHEVSCSVPRDGPLWGSEGGIGSRKSETVMQAK